MVVVQHRAGAGEIQAVRGLLGPRQGHQPVEIGARHRVLRGGRRHLGEPVQLAEGLLRGLLGHAGRLDLLPQLVQLLDGVVPLSQLLLDGLELLAQVVLALALADLGLDLRLDLRPEGQDLGLLGQRGHQPLEPRPHLERLQELLLHVESERGQRGGDGVSQAAGLGHALDQAGQLVGKRRRERHHLLEQGGGAARERLRFQVGGGGRDLGHRLDARLEVRPVLHQLEEPDAGQALDDEMGRAVRLLEDLVHGDERAHPVQVGLAGVLGAGLALGEHADEARAADRLLDRAHRRLAAGRQGDHRQREQHGLPQGQHDHPLRGPHVAGSRERPGRPGSRRSWLAVPPIRSARPVAIGAPTRTRRGDGVTPSDQISMGDSCRDAARTSASLLSRAAWSRGGAMSALT